MSRLSGAQWLQVILWISFAAGAFALTYGFDREIEIYKFGAAGWPRAVIVLLFLAAAGQFLHDLKQDGSGAEDAGETAEDGIFKKWAAQGFAANLRIVLILTLPLAYASLLQPVGYYALTPIFLAAFLAIVGERRIKWLIIVPLGIYFVLTILFTRFLYVGLPTGYWPGFYDFSNWLLVLIR